MTQTDRVYLRGEVPGGESIEFVSVEVFVNPGGPIAIVQYSQDGLIPEFGLRLDMDKEVFLDHFPGAEQEEVAQRAARRIVEYLYDNYFVKADGYRSRQAAN